MSEFKKYRRTNIAEMRYAKAEDFKVVNDISVSETDKNETYNLKIGLTDSAGMIARNPENHNDQWYVAKKYFEDNFELLK